MFILQCTLALLQPVCYQFEAPCSCHIAVLFLQFIRLTGRTTRFNYHIHFVFQELSRALVRRVIYIFAVANFSQVITHGSFYCGYPV